MQYRRFQGGSISLSFLSTSLVAVISAFLTANFVWHSAEPKRDWEQAKQVNTVQYYREFIRKWPAEIQASLAKAAIDRLEISELNAAMEADDLDALMAYSKRWPRGTYSSVVEDRMMQIRQDSLRKAALWPMNMVVSASSCPICPSQMPMPQTSDE